MTELEQSSISVRENKCFYLMLQFYQKKMPSAYQRFSSITKRRSVWMLTGFLRFQSENSILLWSVTFVSLHWLNMRIQTIFTLLQQNHNQLKFNIMIKYKMDYIGIYIAVINVLFYIYNYICVHSSINKSWQCACKAKCRTQWYRRVCTAFGSM